MRPEPRLAHPRKLLLREHRRVRARLVDHVDEQLGLIIGERRADGERGVSLAVLEGIRDGLLESDAQHEHVHQHQHVGRLALHRSMPAERVAEDRGDVGRYPLAGVGVLLELHEHLAPVAPLRRLLQAFDAAQQQLLRSLGQQVRVRAEHRTHERARGAAPPLDHVVEPRVSQLLHLRQVLLVLQLLGDAHRALHAAHGVLLLDVGVASHGVD
mmetsp:Transcript_38654/g.96072  ORF Transcript_38654/g.96072 Transcript_38654/m.96072 type:complete len:213 (-) Transcript_38654:1188-1826(-)